MNSKHSYSVNPFPLATLNSVELVIKGVNHVPSFKNCKRSVINRKTGKLGTMTEPKVKKRMNALEDAITSALFSWYRTEGNETRSECSKQLRILLCGLSDDSIREIPCGSWSTEYVKPGEEGLRITITRI